MNFKLFALFILSLASVALAGPATGNKIDITKDIAQTIKTPAAETLKQWCLTSQMSQPELTQSFKKLVGELKQSAPEQLTDAVVINGHLCQSVQDADMSADELVKDVYMDALSACDKRECMKQLIKCIDSGNVDKVRANYYMTRLAVNDDKSALEQKDMIQELSESLVQSEGQEQSLVNMAIQRQKMFAVTANLAKQIQKEMERGKTWEQCQPDLKQTVERVARSINTRFVKPVTQSDVEEYKQKAKTPAHLSEKIAERNAALKALANIPGHFLQHIDDVQQTLIELAKNKQELSTVRQSAIEALEQSTQVEQIMAEIALHQQDEPTEVRVAAYRCLMSTVFAGADDESNKQQKAHEIVTKVLKYVESTQNQQQDQQFCLYVISHLDNLRTSENPDHAAIRQIIHENKQHHMQISLLNRKFKEQLSKFGKSSRNYQLDQTFDKIGSGLVVEGDLIFDEQQQQQASFLPKLVRVNVSLPIMGQTINVVEVSIRQDNMEKEFIKALRPLQDAKFTAESIEKVVGEFKQQINDQQQRQQQSGMKSQASEADLAIKVDGCTVVYVCADDLKTQTQEGHSRQTRSIRSTSAFEDVLEQLKRHQLSFNRGFHFDFNKRLASIMDVEAHLIGGLVFDSSVKAPRGAQDFEIKIQMEPRISFEALVGPITSTKRLLQRASTKTAFGMRLRYKQNELVDIQIDLPMEEMELFKLESQMVEKKTYQMGEQQLYNRYSYTEDSVYGYADIYGPGARDQLADSRQKNSYSKRNTDSMNRWINMRSLSDNKSGSWNKLLSNKQAIFMQSETPEVIARATGLRSKLNIVASPKDLTFLASCVIKKYEPSMQGFRVQLQKQQHNQLVILVSTPGSRVDRNLRLGVAMQSDSQRTILKTDLTSKLMSGTAQIDLIHDGRQYALRVLAGSSYKFEAGVQRSNQSGKIAVSYKPYLSIQTPELYRPIQVQGLVSYQQSPKTVITYELKTQNSAKFVQGKFILQQRSASSSSAKRGQWTRRSMQSPIALMFQDDVTMTNEIVAQWNELVFKQNVAIESEGNTFGFDMANLYKTKHSHKTEESKMTFRCNLGKDRKLAHLEHRCSTFPTHNFRFDWQYDTTKDQETAKYVSKDTVAQYVYDGQSNKFEVIVDSEGRRTLALQARLDRQGEQYHLDSVAQYKGQPLAKVSGKVPAMLFDEPAKCLANLHRLHKAVVEYDATIYQPEQFQSSGKLDLQKKECSIFYKSDRQQEYSEIKARLDDRAVTILVDAFIKSRNDDAKVQAKINIPGLIQTFTFQTKSSSWSKSQWGVPSWMKGQVETSEIVYNSRNTQLKAKLIPQNEIEIFAKSPRVQHQSRLDLNPNTPIFKFKSQTVLDGRRNCNVDAQVDVQRKMIDIKAESEQSTAQFAFDWPQKKMDLVLDVDGVRVLSHQSSFTRANKFLNFNSASDYYQNPYLTLSGKIPSYLADEPASVFDLQRMQSFFQNDASELNIGSKSSQMKLKLGRDFSVFVKTPSQQHQAHLDMQRGLNFILTSAAQGFKNYKVDVEVSQQQEKTTVRYTDDRATVELIADWQQNKLDLNAELDGRRMVSSQNRFERHGDQYVFNTVAQYQGQQWAKVSAKVPAMLIEKPVEFLQNIHRLNQAVCEFDCVVYQPTLAQVTGKLDIAQQDMFIVYKDERQHKFGQIKARFDERASNIVVDGFHKSLSGEAKTQAKINIPGLIQTFTFQTKSQWGVPSWMKGQVETSEIVYNSRDTQLKAKLAPQNELVVVVKGKNIQHQSRLDLNPDTPVFVFKSDTNLNDYRHCNAQIKVDTEQKMAIIKASYRQTQWESIIDLKNQKFDIESTVDGVRVISHQSRLTRQGKYLTLDTQVEYKQQPYARVQAKIPTIYVDAPESILDEGVSEQTELSYESPEAQMKIKYTPGNELFVNFVNSQLEHQSRISEMQDGIYKLNASQSWKKGGNDYQIDGELNKSEQKSIFKALNKSTGQVLADWALDKRAFLAY